MELAEPEAPTEPLVMLLTIQIKIVEYLQKNYGQSSLDELIVLVERLKVSVPGLDAFDLAFDAVKTLEKEGTVIKSGNDISLCP